MIKNNRNKLVLPLFFLWTTLLIVGFLLAASYTPSFGEPALLIDADQQFEFAEQYFQAGEYYRGIGEYRRFAYFFPKDPRNDLALYRIGLAYGLGKKPEEGVETLSLLLTTFPKTRLKDKALFGLSAFYVQMEEFSEAIDALDKILAWSKDKAIADEARYRKGIVYLDADDPDKAKESFRLISDKNKDIYRTEEVYNEIEKEDVLSPKSPALAGLLAIIPGAGHAYCGRYKDAGIALILNTVMACAAFEAFNHDQEVLGGIIGFLELGFYTGNIYSAVNSVHKYNKAAKRGFIDSLKERSIIKLGLSKNSESISLGIRF
ncbi:MAG: tetratricopeptide repeat protein [Pseudomonadota bacterium]